MSTVERVKAICKERKIPLAKLERDLGFSNGYVGQLKKGVFPDERLKQIAQYLGVTIEFLLSGEDPEEPYYLDPEAMEIAEFLYHHPEYKVLFDASRKVKPEDLQYVKELIDRLTR